MDETIWVGHELLLLLLFRVTEDSRRVVFAEIGFVSRVACCRRRSAGAVAIAPTLRGSILPRRGRVGLLSLPLASEEKIAA